MGFIDKLFGRDKKAKAPAPAAAPASGETFYILNLNARLMPLHRGEVYEDPLEEALQKAGLGSISGGGTLMGADKEIKNCDIEICLKDGSQESQKKLEALLEGFVFPKGSSLSRCGDGEEKLLRGFGTLEGLALYLNGTSLPDEVYESCDINHVISEIGGLLGGSGRLMSWQEGASDTALYFYGDSFEDMRGKMEPFLAEYPLCRECRVEQIA